MSEANDLRDFQQRAALRDGTPITIRIARADDHDRLEAAFAKLDSETSYTRYFGFRKEIGEDAVGGARDRGEDLGEAVLRRVEARIVDLQLGVELQWLRAVLLVRVHADLGVDAQSLDEDRLSVHVSAPTGA